MAYFGCDILNIMLQIILQPNLLFGHSGEIYQQRARASYLPSSFSIEVTNEVGNLSLCVRNFLKVNLLPRVVINIAFEFLKRVNASFLPHNLLSCLEWTDCWTHIIHVYIHICMFVWVIHCVDKRDSSSFRTSYISIQLSLFICF